MRPDHEFMLKLTADMPCKQININDSPYMQRYYAGTFVNGRKEVDLWFHRFLSADGDRHLHWHPMNFRSKVVMGFYSEEYLEDGVKKTRGVYEGNINKNYLINLCAAARQSWPLRKLPADVRSIGMHDIHRIDKVTPNTWTVLFVEPERIPAWGFIDEADDIEIVRTSGRFWWKDYKPRGQNVGDSE